MNLREIVDILGIILPALIILLGIIRLFSKNRRGHNTLTMFFALLLLLTGLIRFYIFPGASKSDNSESKMKPVHVSKHSEVFNQSFENILNAYYKMTEAFVNSDTSAIDQSGNDLKTALDNLKAEELKVDTIIYQTAMQFWENAKTEGASILAAPSLDKKRNSMKSFSDELFSLVSTVHYDVVKLYWLECDKAFGENNPGNWLSLSEKSANPYGQKDCAEVKTNINFVPVDTTIKAK
jgi:Protein of unknown function (DUF3347)